MPDMKPFALIALPLLFAMTSLTMAQQSDEALDAPIPIPRPEHLGGEPGVGIRQPAASQAPVTTEPQPVSLSARSGDSGPFITDGLVWRVFSTELDQTGELAMLSRSTDAATTLSLPPGEYVLHAAYGRAQASETLRVEPGPNNHVMIFELGGLQLNAAVVGDVPIPSDLLRFDVFANGPGGQTSIAESVAVDELLHLNTGVYSITSHFGPINAVVRAEIRVEANEVTQATLYHRAAQVSLKLVSEEGGEAIAAVEWEITDMSGTTLFTELGAFPATVLAEGTYTVIAQLGDQVYNREFEVIPGAPREIEVLTAVY